VRGPARADKNAYCWTESYLVALYFAVRDADGNHDAAVWATSPWWINREALGDYKLFSADASDAFPWRPGVAEFELPETALAIKPVYGSPRIQAQRGSLHDSRKGRSGTRFVGQETECRCLSPKVHNSGCRDSQHTPRT
jgi:hypothetical protein